MKKIFSFVLTLIISLSVFSLVGCKKSKKNQVKLISISQVSESTVAYSGGGDKIDFVSSGVNRVSDEEQEENQYMVVNEGEYYFTLKITLENPNNYYILDFSLESSDENFKVKINDKYALLTDLPSLRWNSDTNYFCEIECYSTESNYKTTVEMKSLYYSDRTDGSNKYDGDITKNNLFNIYKKSEGIEFEKYSLFKIKVNIVGDEVDRNSLYYNGVNISDGEIIKLNFGDTIINFKCNFDDITKEYSKCYTLNSRDYVGTMLSASVQTGVVRRYYYTKFDFEKVELYRNDEYVKDGEKISKDYGNYEADFGLEIIDGEYILIYNEEFIVKCGDYQNRAEIIWND